MREGVLSQQATAAEDDLDEKHQKLIRIRHMEVAQRLHATLIAPDFNPKT